MQYTWLFAKGLHDIRMCKWLPIRTHEIRQVRSASRQKGRFTYMRAVQGKTVKANETVSELAPVVEAVGAPCFVSLTLGSSSLLAES